LPLPYFFETSAFVCDVWPLSDEVHVAVEPLPAVPPVVQWVQWVVVELGFTPACVWLEACVDFACCFALPGDGD
jgi:hypothetical protein